MKRFKILYFALSAAYSMFSKTSKSEDIEKDNTSQSKVQNYEHVKQLENRRKDSSESKGFEVF